MATAIGRRYLTRYAEGTASVTQLQQCVTRGYITQAEYDDAVALYPPGEDGYHHPAPDAAEEPAADEGGA